MLSKIDFWDIYSIILTHFQFVLRLFFYVYILTTISLELFSYYIFFKFWCFTIYSLWNFKINLLTFSAEYNMEIVEKWWPKFKKKFENLKNPNCANCFQRSFFVNNKHFWKKNEIFVKNRNFLSKMDFCQKSNFLFKIDIFKNVIFPKNSETFF